MDLQRIFWAGLLIWQMAWLSQSGPGLQPEPAYYWGSIGLAALSITATLKGRHQLAAVTLTLAGLSALATVSSAIFRILVFWSYCGGFITAARDFREHPSKLRRAVLSTYLCLFGLNLFLVVGEIGMRVLTWSKDVSRIPCLSYNNTPWITGALYNRERNSMGLRGPEVPQFKPPDKVRILFLGDSVTFGLGIPLEDTLVRQVERGLGGNVETLNLSMPGWNLEDELSALTTKGAYYEPDMVVWVFFPNDIEHMGWETGFIGINPSLDSLYRSWIFYQYLKSHYNILLGAIGLRDTYLSQLQRAYAGTSYEQHFSGAFQRMAYWCQRNNKRLVVVLFPFMEDLEHYPLELAHQKVAATASQLHVPCLDLLPIFRGKPLNSVQLNPTFDHHPSRLANNLAAEAVIPFLRQFLQGSAPR